MPHQPREVLFTGSFPIRPPAKVFETVTQYLGDRVRRIPDGEMMGWLREIWRSHEENPALEKAGMVKLNGRAPSGPPSFRVKPGFAHSKVKFGPYGYAKNARQSYAEFKKLRDQGKIPAGTRFQVTMPGPGTTVFIVKMPADVLLPLAAEALWTEISEVLEVVPAADLTIHLDVAMEAEHEEYLRRPEAFDTPIHEFFHWTHAQMADAVASVSNRIPPSVELGFHICSIWHHWQAGGQDNTVLVDTANALSSRIGRPIAYIHIPVIPEHTAPQDYAPFANLRLHPETKLFLGLINLADGLGGATRRIRLAEQFVTDFGVAFYCGIGRPPDPRLNFATETAELMNNPALRRATPETIGEMMDLHRQVADVP